jgi:hypothetical protein
MEEDDEDTRPGPRGPMTGRSGAAETCTPAPPLTRQLPSSLRIVSISAISAVWESAISEASTMASG